MYDKNHANNMFNHLLYQILCNLFWEKDIIYEANNLKL